MLKGLPKHFTQQTLQTHLLTHATPTPTGCLEYHGYGTNPRTYQKGPGRAWSHRAAYTAFIGPIPNNTDIEHLCDNPPCIQPTHLQAVTHAANMSRLRGKPNRASCTHPRTTNPTTGKLQRCKPCNAEAQRRWRHNQAHTTGSQKPTMTAHNPPRDDLIHHEHNDQCVCGPTITPIVDHNGNTHTTATHHRLDGRDNRRNP